MKYEYTSQRAVRAAFWRECGNLRGVSRRLIMNYAGTARNMHNTDTRCAFTDWLDMASKDGRLSKELADRVTL